MKEASTTSPANSRRDFISSSFYSGTKPDGSPTLAWVRVLGVQVTLNYKFCIKFRSFKCLLIDKSV